jgi:hypothetical protein
MRPRTELLAIAHDGHARAWCSSEARWRRRAAPPRAARPPSPPAAALPASPALPPPLRARRRWPALISLLVLLGGLGSLGAWHARAQDEQFSLQLSAGCEELEPCQKLEAEASRRAQACWLGCGRELAEQRVARLQRYRAEERLAVREHYRQRDDAERSAEQLERERRLVEWQREQAARSLASEQEQRQRLELERLRQAHIDRRLLEERQRRIGYLTLLGAEGRLERLRRCHADKAGCEALILDLVEAASLAEEKQKLARENEKLLADPVRAAATPRRPKPPAPNSRADTPQPQSAHC